MPQTACLLIDDIPPNAIVMDMVLEGEEEVS
jgi:hypothetical protein